MIIQKTKRNKVDNERDHVFRLSIALRKKLEKCQN